jgi:hypothetical protein
MNADEIKALDHAWNWFSLHAAQRMQTFNFFLVAIAFLVAAYASLLDKSHWAAAFIAAAAAWLAFCGSHGWRGELNNLLKLESV